MARDILAMQASSVASEDVFSAARFQLGEHRHSLAADSLEISTGTKYVKFTDLSVRSRFRNNTNSHSTDFVLVPELTGPVHPVPLPPPDYITWSKSGSTNNANNQVFRNQVPNSINYIIGDTVYVTL
uniref:HAT C-terminal dimerisation domain-containing protein n=1 Tax=Solanum lycopersicum TaxID=4081 RepID=A0A3Q7FKK4_SOLLC